jgi:starch phosphorylase
VREYTEQHYLTAASAYLERAADKGAIGVDIIKQQRELDQKWMAIHFGEVKVQTDGEQHIFEVQIYLDDISPELVRVELYANSIDGTTPEKISMNCVRQLVGAINGYTYRASISSARPENDYTARIIPNYNNALVPLEGNYILWQR